MWVIRPWPSVVAGFIAEPSFQLGDDAPTQPVLGVDFNGYHALAGLLFAAWANLHGGWVTGAAALTVHVAIRAARAPRDAPQWLLLAACSVLATLATPYGFGLWQFLTATVRISRPDITE